METYIFKFSACLVVFWLLYALLLERQTMHHFKRFYLLGAFALSLAIPALTITEYVEPVAMDYDVSDMYIPFEAEFVELPAEKIPEFTLETILWAVYTLGVILLSIRFLVNLIRLYKRISDHPKHKKQSLIYVLLSEYRIPHSFFKYIFVNQKRFEEDQIPNEVILHEEAHAKQLHSVDILLVEFLQIIFWFNPLVYVLKHHIKLNHEFLADDAVLQQGANTKVYQNILLQFSSSTGSHQLSSAINYSSFKKRFTVMKTQTSKTRIWLSTLLLLPITALLFYSFAEREYVEKDQDLLDSIKQELEKADKLNMVYIDSASEALMQEYRDFIVKYKATNVIIGDTYNRAVIIYEDIMNDTQRASVEKYPNRMVPEMNLSKVKARKPSSSQFEAFKNAEEYAIWIDGKHVPNSALNNYSVDDFVHFTGSIVHKNARSKKFPQPNQYQLYTKKGFKETYQDSQVNKYKQITKNYSNAISKYLKGSRSDNSELKILKAKADKIYNSFTKEELKKHNILPAPPVPAEDSEWQKVEDILSQQEATKKQVAEYNAWAKKINMAMKKAESTNNKSPYPIIKKKEYDKYDNLYRNIMSEKQRNNAEPWPNSPPPPPPPPAPKVKKGDGEIPPPPPPPKPNKTKGGPMEVNGNTYYYYQENGKTTYYDSYGNKVDIDKVPPPPPTTPSAPKKLADFETTKEGTSGYTVVNGEKIYYSSKNGETTYYDRFGNKVEMDNLPPPPPKSESAYNFVKSLKNDDITYYFNDKEVSYDDILKITKANPKISVSTNIKNNKGTAKFWIEKETYKDQLPIVNGKTPKSPKLEMTIAEFKKLELTLKSGKISEFKVKIPGIKTDYTKGNTLSKTTIANLKSIKVDDVVVIFDIKDDKDNKLSPLQITITE
ncbi:M56 family metallopeptidase [Winogradskyella sp. SYSU M77433]|uniref:M56 family metallopeptidase n=1 Tax=Winogradskyella sp. SYSU M77433 TaxID=3042722 RepID=UPI0024808DF8|nr:M56 family metallopeptidase [Winogradskyella sp. SYSU M77433]MDH7912046.1 M56 family metallopeptidase [Winogradskyella sp. SYSU M77433]